MNKTRLALNMAMRKKNRGHGKAKSSEELGHDKENA